MTYKDISDFRAKLMGVSIIWIVLFHLNMAYSLYEYLPGYLSAFATAVLDMGNIGVEIFLLCSGFGLCFSIRKDPSIKKFYVRRAKRLYPEYLTGLVLVELISGFSPVFILLHVIPVQFFISYECLYWLIALIFLFYAVFPLIFKLLTDGKGSLEKPRVICLIAVITVVTVIMHLRWEFYDYQLCMVFDRLIVFVIGIVLGIKYDPEKVFIGKSGILYMTLGLFGMLNIYILYLYTPVLQTYFFKYYIYAPLSVMISIMLVLLFKKIRSKHSFLALAGRLSLEIYIADGIREQIMCRLKDHGLTAYDRPLFALLEVVIFTIVVHYAGVLIRKAARI